jgi:hypothetical protein
MPNRTTLAAVLMTVAIFPAVADAIVAGGIGRKIVSVEAVGAFLPYGARSGWDG